MTVDLEMIRSRLDDVNENVKLLKEIDAKVPKRTAYDPVNKAAAERLLQVSIEAMLDIASHLIAALRLRKPDKYADAPAILREAEILSPSVMQKFEEMIRFRNLLVHAYAKVDSERLREFIGSNLVDFESFKSEVAAFLAKTKNPKEQLN